MSPLDLGAIARRLVLDAGFSIECSPAAQAEADHAAPGPLPPGVRDLRHLLWSSIDNDTSRDLDQIEWAEPIGADQARLLVGIADVDALVPAGSALDAHAAGNTTSLYLGVQTFPMLPRRLSEDLTSLHEGQDRMAIVLDLRVDASGEVACADLFRAQVRNAARLSYPAVGAWLEGRGPAPAPAGSPLQAQLRLHDRIGTWLAGARQRRGALALDTVEVHPVMRGGRMELELVSNGRARGLIEDLMLATNAAMATFFEARDLSWIRRTVQTPRRWDRMVALAAEAGEVLPAEPSAEALAAFVQRRRAAAPDRFVELSLAVVKLLGPGSYALERAGQDLPPHFALALSDYTHSTAPNRRYADLVTQRLVKAALAGQPTPYDDVTLEAVAARCTSREDEARRVSRRMRKVAAAALLRDRIGEQFTAQVTGVRPDATYVRLLHPPAEGRLVRGQTGLDVGDRLTVRLLATDVDRGHLDFASA